MFRNPALSPRFLAVAAVLLLITGCGDRTKTGSVVEAKDNIGGVGRDEASSAVVQLMVAGSGGIRTGTGFVADGDEGVVVALSRSVEGAETVWVRFRSDSTYYRATKLGTDERYGLVALRVSVLGAPDLALQAGRGAAVGSEVTVVGSLVSPASSVHRGILRGVSRSGAHYVLDVAQPLPAAAYGGPVLTADGKAIGVADAGNDVGGPATLVIPSSRIAALLERSRGKAGAEFAPPGQELGPRASVTSRRPPVATAERARPPKVGAESPRSAVLDEGSDPDVGRRTGRQFDLTGSWLLVNQIDETRHSSHRGLKLGFRVYLRQEGDRLTGTGEKISEEGLQVGYAARSPIRIEGRVRDGLVRAEFIERGTRRTIHGSFRWSVSEDGEALAGRFRDTEIGTGGSSVAFRIE